MDKKTKDFIRLFNQGFEEVVLPQLEGLWEDMKLGFTRMDKKFAEFDSRFSSLDSRLDSVERKVDRLVDQDFDTKATLQNHEKRLKKLETTRITV